MKELKEKEYEISLKTVKENIVKVSAISRDEALKSAEDLVLAPDYEKMNNTKNTRTYVVVDSESNSYTIIENGVWNIKFKFNGKVDLENFK